MARALWRAAPLLLCYGICHLGLIVYSTFPLPPSSFPAHEAPVVCLVGNAPDEEAANRVFNMWGARFAAAYYLWNTTSLKVRTFRRLTYIIAGGSRRLTFAEGMETALERARSIIPPCDYYFTHDDDLHFTVVNATNSTSTHIADVLIHMLAKYRPLVASFPWEAGLRRHRNLAEIQSAWSANEVGPMIAFDNGMVLYHRSIADFFIPYAPRGEGGFVGHWTLGAHFINLFVTLALRNHSICINSLRYRNTINLDNLSNELRNDHVIDPSGLVYYKTGSRHAYEWPLNRAYKKFLSSGLKCVRNCRWGRDLLLNDIRDWNPSTLEQLPDQLEIVRKVASVYHIQHEALQNNRFLATFSENEIQSVLTLLVPYSLRINVFVYNRPASFERLWSSLVRALGLVHCNCTITVHVHQDYEPQESSAWKRQTALLATGRLEGVTFVPHLYSSHQGLRREILSSWDPQTDDEFCLFLEDDIELADLALHYVSELIRQYWYAPPLPWSKLLGISLYRPRYSEVTESFITFNHHNPLFLYEYPSSWGQVFAARPWRAFLDWEATEKASFLIPNSYTNRWPSSSSWKKALLRWMVLTGSLMLYPNMFGNSSLATNHLESGTNDKLKPNSTALLAMKAKFTVPLVLAGVRWPRNELPALAPIPQVDAWGILSTVRPRDVSTFDTCTVIMAVCHRVDFWKDRILHFKNATFISSVIIVWQHCIANRSAPLYSEIPTVPFAVRILSKNNSLNNRFLPLPNVSTDCIISIDDDFDMPLRNISFAVDTWRGHFWNHLVGFAGFGRNHFRTSESLWRYSTSERENFSSMVLPTCFIYHRKYQAMYANLPAEVLDYVDKIMNCDDILFNFLVSNFTKSGPVIVDGEIWPVYVREVEKLGGLWHRPNHFSVRSECLNYFVTIFGGMPLRYTTSYFNLEQSYGSSPGVPPGLRHHKWSKEVPHVS